MLNGGDVSYTTQATLCLDQLASTMDSGEHGDLKFDLLKCFVLFVWLSRCSIFVFHQIRDKMTYILWGKLN